MDIRATLPPQQISYKKKTKLWRKRHLDFATQHFLSDQNNIRSSIRNKQINYDLLNGKLHMKDLQLILNPSGIVSDLIPDRIQHYPIMNSKLNVLRGEESARPFDYRVIVTNPNAISEIENNKKEQILQRLVHLIESKNLSEEEYTAELEKLSKYYTYEWQDMREIKGNALLQHYSKELDFPLIFNQGFMDAMAIGEEMYQVDIVGGEPSLTKLNPRKVRVLRSGFSPNVEDADMVILEDYWSPGRIIDTYYDVLTKQDIDYIEKLPYSGSNSDSMDNIDERKGFINTSFLDLDGRDADIQLFAPQNDTMLMPYDYAGNVRVVRVYWKSRKRIKKVKSYDIFTGEVIYNFYPEDHIINRDAGEEEEVYFINEAWEGTKIGEKIYVNMRPRPIQYNRLSNPSRCHFGIIGTIYNLNDDKPFSMVDMMKPYNYLYDVIHDRLNKTIAKNWGKIVRLDLSKVPKGWDVEKWLYYAKNNGLAVEDSFREGNYGASTHILSGSLNNNSSGVIDAEFGNSIQQYINLLEFIKMEMSEVAGISRQREGQIHNRETVGGIERSTLQSSHITEWLFRTHENLKIRVLNAFLETAKIALKGNSKKFQYLLPDYANKTIDISGDEFAELDYGIAVDNSKGTLELNQKLDMLAQAALQNQALSFSTIMKLYSSSSLAEKQRFVQTDETEMQARAEQAQQAQAQQAQQAVEIELQTKQMELEQKERENIRDNETKLAIARLQAELALIKNSNFNEEVEEEYSEKDKEELEEKIRQFDEKLKLDKERLALDKKKAEEDLKLRQKSITNRKKNEK